MKNIDSCRQYRIAVCDQIGLTIEKMTINSILENDTAELHFAIVEIIDEVLDLKPNESVYFQPNRDDKNSKGIILRIK